MEFCMPLAAVLLMIFFVSSSAVNWNSPSLCDLPFLPSSPQTLSWLVFQFWFLFMHEWNANLAHWRGKKKELWPFHSAFMLSLFLCLQEKSSLWEVEMNRFFFAVTQVELSLWLHQSVVKLAADSCHIF